MYGWPPRSKQQQRDPATTVPTATMTYETKTAVTFYTFKSYLFSQTFSHISCQHEIIETCSLSYPQSMTKVATTNLPGSKENRVYNQRKTSDALLCHGVSTKVTWRRLFFLRYQKIAMTEFWESRRAIVSRVSCFTCAHCWLSATIHHLTCCRADGWNSSDTGHSALINEGN